MSVGLSIEDQGNKMLSPKHPPGNMWNWSSLKTNPESSLITDLMCNLLHHNHQQRQKKTNKQLAETNAGRHKLNEQQYNMNPSKLGGMNLYGKTDYDFILGKTMWR